MFSKLSICNLTLLDLSTSFFKNSQGKNYLKDKIQKIHFKTAIDVLWYHWL